MPLNGSAESISELHRTATNTVFDAILQLDPVDTFCAGESGNAISVPELGTTAINFISFIGVVGGIFVAVAIGLLGWGLSKGSSTTTGGGGGKKYILLGIAMICAGVLVQTVPSMSEQVYAGASQCFAMIQPTFAATLA